MTTADKDEPRSGETSPDVPATPANSEYNLRRTSSQETLITNYSTPSSAPSLNYPNPPYNTPATQSIASGNMSTVADIEDLTKELRRASLSPPADAANGDTEEEDRSATPTLQSFASRNGDAESEEIAHTHEFSIWAPFAEEDVDRALKRMAMLARDEHQINPRYSVKAYYSARLAKLIAAAEVEFDASTLH